MKNWLASAAAIIALIALPIDTASAYPGSHSSGGNHSSGGGNSGGNLGGNGGRNFSGNGGGNLGNNLGGNSGRNLSSNGNSNSHPSNSNGHPNSKNLSLNSNSTGNSHLNKNSSGNNHSNNAHNNSNHYHYTHQHGKGWDPKEWNHAWYRHWYHGQFIFWAGGWIWWDPDVSAWVPYVEGQYIPEDYYVQGQEPPAGGGAILIVNPTDTQTTINYAINDNDYQIAPGSQQELSADQQWVISFDRGENDGTAQYTLSPGIYTFGPSDHGWELFHTSDTVDN